MKSIMESAQCQFPVLMYWVKQSRSTAATLE